VIHLAQETERLKCLQENYAAIGLKDYVVFPACDGRKELPRDIWGKMYSLWATRDFKTVEGIQAFENQRKGEAGCFMSHFRVIKEVRAKFEEALRLYEQAKAEGESEALERYAKEVKRFSSVLVLEDDNGFGFLAQDGKSVTTKGCGVLLRLALIEMPLKWDMLYFVAQSQYRSHSVGRFLRRIYGTKGANAYVVHYSLYERLLKHLSAIEDPAVKLIYPLDHQLSQLHADAVCLAVAPSIAYQTPGYSIIHARHIPIARQGQGDF
jgi:GR25 family glycosyltransferase involved in LPS biosynthesis